MQPGHSGTDAAAALATVLAPGFLRKLDRLHLSVRRSLSTRPGNTPMPRGSQGSGIEIERHKAYGAGDDLRHLDWALLGRLGRPFLKTYEQEEDLTVHLLLDTSRSMSFGEPPKLLAAARIAAALAHIALGSLDRVGAGLFDGRGLRLHPPARGRGALLRLLRFLAAAVAGGGGGMEGPLKLHAAAARPGLTVVLSDFLEPGFRDALRPHRGRRHSLVLVQLLAREELEPALDGDLRLVDAESGAGLEATVGPKERARYLARLEGERRALRDFGLRYGVDVFSLPADLPLEDALWGHLLRGSFLARA